MNATPQRDTQRPPSARDERRELAELLPPPAVPGLDPDRQLLLRREVLHRAAASAASAGPQGGTTRRPARYRHPVRIAVPALACALAVVGVVTAGPGGPAGHDRAAVTGDGTTGTSHAVRLLDRVALAAGAEQSTVRADQFVYVESRVAYAAQSTAGGPVSMAPVHTRQVWLSADGTRPGLLREEGGPDTRLGENGPVLHLDRPGETARPDTPRRNGPSVGEPTNAYVASLPTDPDALLKLIREQTRGKGQDPDQRAFTAIGDLLAETWAPPQVSAALYRAAGRIPGVTEVASAVDAAGREGIAVARTAHGQQTQWIFDRTTYAFLGERTVLTEAGETGPTGTVVGTSAVLTKAAVDRAGQLPSTDR
ncbi:CU044_5270 family protein [Kitasatospora sp. NPDC004615]|uniref:CU044_5270 family protein n=1 Tax=Kitasatospora sp. NPDC004615 TaxID=3364017 RepID=UPI00367D9711